MTTPAIPDIISVVGSAYYQPIADLIERLVSRPMPAPTSSGSGHHEKGYSASIIVLLVTLLESYTSRLRFVRSGEGIPGNLGTVAQLLRYYPELPNIQALDEVFLVRNAIAHNHVWHLDVAVDDDLTSPVLSDPKKLGFHTNASFARLIEPSTRRTRLLGLNAVPTAVDRTDVRKVFAVVWQTLSYMNKQSFSDTPLGGRSVTFDRRRIRFEDLQEELLDRRILAEESGLNGGVM